MSTRKPGTSSKRKKTTPQKLKGRKVFAYDINEQPQISKATDEEEEEEMVSAKHPETHTDKENMPEEYPNGAVTANKGRGRPKGSKNKTFPTSPTRVYSVREGKSQVYTERPARDTDTGGQNGEVMPHRGRGRPKGTTKVKPMREDVPKRSRGRPKGSKNKKPSKAALLKLIPATPKGGRGRPRKRPQSNDTLTPKRGRGRPKGSLNKIPSAKRLAILEGTSETKNPKNMILHHSTSNPPTPKRPRGRPKSMGSLNLVQSCENKPQEENEDDGGDDDGGEEDNDDVNDEEDHDNDAGDN